MNRKAWGRLRDWYGRQGRHDLPWRTARGPWRVLLSEVLLHRTRANQVAAIYPALAESFSCPEAVVEGSQAWIEQTRSVGLAWRASKFVDACRILITHYGGEVPRSGEALRSLPGVGAYVASAVQCFGFGERASLVDTNTIRLAFRLKGATAPIEGHRTRAVREAVAELSCDGDQPDAADNYALLDLGALVCLARNPRCMECPLKDWCECGQRRLLVQAAGPRIQRPGAKR